eukprot:CAMPEP_0202897472 /NCGR_PEP_ID=MMETSP1392-20130828/6220_1 /ASSEMBLY_ACC=CAM_ASM_000868 /TAXON_ID=225041 /ORGANISM="Chlamydomonas chlamydogama, Strain SAG 11-48b" /LENGTH=178 /DNA_ID=CAMNT_0049583107 /DNA_START=367 /DNA_END=903 /DNA_ORIENTATION=-
MHRLDTYCCSCTSACAVGSDCRRGGDGDFCQELSSGWCSGIRVVRRASSRVGCHRGGCGWPAAAASAAAAACGSVILVDSSRGACDARLVMGDAVVFTAGAAVAPGAPGSAAAAGGTLGSALPGAPSCTAAPPALACATDMVDGSGVREARDVSGTGVSAGPVAARRGDGLSFSGVVG